MRTAARSERKPLYSRLDEAKKEIRLIRVEQSDDDDSTIQCSLTTTALEDSLPFAGLSYVWGDPNVTTEIVIDGYPTKVTSNLADFLQQFRRFRRMQPDKWIDLVWIDANRSISKMSPSATPRYC